jgi:hypothetical protein
MEIEPKTESCSQVNTDFPAQMPPIFGAWGPLKTTYLGAMDVPGGLLTYSSIDHAAPSSVVLYLFTQNA